MDPEWRWETRVIQNDIFDLIEIVKHAIDLHVIRSFNRSTMLYRFIFIERLACQRQNEIQRADCISEDQWFACIYWESCHFCWSRVIHLCLRLKRVQSCYPHFSKYFWAWILVRVYKDQMERSHQSLTYVDQCHDWAFNDIHWIHLWSMFNLMH